MAWQSLQIMMFAIKSKGVLREVQGQALDLSCDVVLLTLVEYFLTCTAISVVLLNLITLYVIVLSLAECGT